MQERRQPRSLLHRENNRERSSLLPSHDRFLEICPDKYPKATQCLEKDRDVLMTVDDCPAQHWQRMRTTSPITSTFATTGHRIRCTHGCLTQNGMLHRIFKLGLCAEKTWRQQRGFNARAKVIGGVKSRAGIEVIESDRAVV